MEPLIGFEYEGVSPVGYRNTTIDLSNTQAGFVKEHLYVTNDFPVFTKDPDKNCYRFWTYRLHDNYDALAELRFNPVYLDANISTFVNSFKALQSLLFPGVYWGEKLIDIKDHKSALESLKFKTGYEQRERERERGGITGQFLEYNFKTPITLVNDLPVAWDSDKECRYRGGGLHINISPVNPENAIDFIKRIHEKLFPINEQFQLQSNYRQQLLFRYRDYKGTPGVEYMSLGINMEKLTVSEIEDIFRHIFKTIKEEINV